MSAMAESQDKEGEGEGVGEGWKRGSAPGLCPRHYAAAALEFSAQWVWLLVRLEDVYSVVRSSKIIEVSHKWEGLVWHSFYDICTYNT